MKLFSHYCAVAVLIGCLAFPSSVLAGDCCAKTKDAVKKGEACEKCVEHACCKAAAKDAAKDKDAKPCSKCAKKEEKPAK